MADALTSRRKSTAGTPVTHLIITTDECDLTCIYSMIDPAGAATRYIMLFDSATLPANGTAPVVRWDCAVGTAHHQSFNTPEVLAFDNGCVVAVSTTAGTLTLAPAEGHFMALYEGRN